MLKELVVCYYIFLQTKTGQHLAGAPLEPPATLRQGEWNAKLLSWSQKKTDLDFFFFFFGQEGEKKNQYSRVHHESAFPLVFCFVKLQSDPWQKLMPNCLISLLQPRVAPRIDRRCNKYPGSQHSPLSHHAHFIHQATNTSGQNTTEC